GQCRAGAGPGGRAPVRTAQLIVRRAAGQTIFEPFARACVVPVWGVSMSQITFQLRQLVQRMWFLPAAFSLIAVLSIAIAWFLARFAPETLPFTMPSNGVMSILTILASSLLTVAVFALSTMVSALSSASASTSPRAMPLITGDRSAQTSISVFIGAFLFSIVGIIGLS